MTFLASYQHGWNITLGNASSTAVDISWLPLKTNSLNSTDIYGYVAVCFHNGTSDAVLSNVENASSFNTVVHNLTSYRRYQVKVVALFKNRVTGEIILKSSEKVDIRTKEGGE